MIAYLIVLILVMAVVLIGVNFYLLLHYVHRDDKKWTTAPYCKVLILLGLTFCQAQALAIPLDITNQGDLLATTNQNDKLRMATFWVILYCVVLAFICLFAPYAMFLYETDEEKKCVRRMLTALLYTFVSLVISCMIVFISWVFLKEAQIPVEQLTIQAEYYGQALQGNPIMKNLIVEVSIPVYIVAVLSFAGWLLLMVFGGIGLVSLPIDLINEFLRRPRVRKSKEMEQTRGMLVKALKALLESGKDLEASGDLLTRNSEATCCQRFRGRRKINSKLGYLKAKYYALTEQFQIFNLELKLAHSNPLVPFLKLSLGIIFALTSLIWVIQIVSVGVPTLESPPLFPFLNQLFIALDQANAELVSTCLFAYLNIYLLWCMQKGNIKFGVAAPFCCRFHPMKEKQTWLNSFLFNVILMCMASVAISQLSVTSFPLYAGNSQIYTLFGVNVNYLTFYSIFYRNNVFVFTLLGFSALTLIYLLVTCNRRPKYMQDVEDIRKWGQRRRKQEDLQRILENN